MLGASVAIFAVVSALLLYAALRDPARRTSPDPERVILGGGIVLPIVALSVLLPFGIRMGSSVTGPREPDTLTIRVHARQWWWEIEYDDGTAAGAFTAANELYFPVGVRVELLLTSADVIHSLWLPKLAGKLDLIPSRTNRMMIEADRPGVIRGQCAEFCGVAHAKMGLYATAVPRQEFAMWATRQRAAAVEPADDLRRKGRRDFMASGCALCHTVRGTEAWGRGGPDLTHVGSRMTIGAGTLALTRGNLAAWISHNDRLKPGNRMPDFVDLNASTRDAIAAYLEGLK